MSKLTEATLTIDSILGLVAAYRDKATYHCHEMSDCEGSYPFPCADDEVSQFMKNLKDEVETAALTVSDIEWVVSGGCVGDILLPVKLKATRLPDGRYYLELFGDFKTREFVYAI